MASSKQDGTAAATEQLGSMSLGESVERRKEKEPEPTPKNWTKTKFCLACEKESDALKTCNGCQCVWYCDKKCQNKHRKEHKKECRVIKKELDKRGGKLDLGTEEDIGPLGKLIPREECHICMQVLPIHPNLHSYAACCGKKICGGCDFQHGRKNTERTCPFCRTAAPGSDEETLAQLRKRVERKDPQALLSMAIIYGEGLLGLSVDHAKCIALMRQAADLGLPGAQWMLGNFYRDGEMGLEQSEEEVLKYLGKAAKVGHTTAQSNLGCIAGEKGYYVAAMCLFRLSASGGQKVSMENLIEYFEHGLLRHADLAESLQAMYCARAEMRSQDRDKYVVHLKITGEYYAEFDDI